MFHAAMCCVGLSELSGVPLSCFTLSRSTVFTDVSLNQMGSHVQAICQGSSLLVPGSGNLTVNSKTGIGSGDVGSKVPHTMIQEGRYRSPPPSACSLSLRLHTHNPLTLPFRNTHQNNGPELSLFLYALSLTPTLRSSQQMGPTLPVSK